MTEEHLTEPREITGLAISSRARALLRLLRAAWREYERDYARYYASAMVYYALISLGPLLLLLFGALGLLMRWSDAVGAMRLQALNAIGETLGAELRMTIEQLVDGMERQSVVATVISLVALLWSGSVIARHLRMTFRAIWRVAPPLVSGSLPVVIRTTLMEKAIALGMLLSGGVLVLAAVALLELINRLSAAVSIGWLLAIPSSFVVVPVTFALLFTYLPPDRVPWRHVKLATLLCTSGWLIGVDVLGLYGAFFGQHLNVYGAIGGILVVMLWMNVVAQGLFLGAELCKVSYWWSNPEHAPARRS